MHTWNIYDDFDAASKSTANFLADKIKCCIEENNICHVVLSGGNTPARCLNYLAEKPISWEKVHWYLSDERCYPAGHHERNDLMIRKNLWTLISETNIHAIPAELGAEAAAEIYRDVVSSVGFFDVVFLGIGEDGHTASLFPENKALLDEHSVVAVYDSPKSPSNRVSLSMSILKKSLCRVVLACGNSKSEIISRVKKGETLPINGVGDINWYIDNAVCDLS